MKHYLNSAAIGAVALNLTSFGLANSAMAIPISQGDTIGGVVVDAKTSIYPGIDGALPAVEITFAPTPACPMSSIFL